MDVKKGYVNGSDVLLYINGKAVGHCTTHTVNFNSETKERAVKPVASKPISSGLYKEKTVTGLSYSISADGLRFYNESECGYKDLVKLWKAAVPVTVKCMERGNAEKPYLEGDCVISTLSENDTGQDDATYSISLDNSGEPKTIDEEAITETIVEEG